MDRIGEQLDLTSLVLGGERQATPAHRVGDARLGPLHDEDALCGEKTVRHAAVPKIDQSARRRRDDLPEDRIVEFGTTAGQITETRGIDQLERVKVHPHLLIAFIHQRNRRVIDRGSSTCLIHESLHPVDVLAVLAVERLERDMTSDRGLLRFVEREIGVALDLAEELVIA